MPFNSYDSILAALSAGQGQDILFAKTLPAAQAAGLFYSSWAHVGFPAAAAAYQGNGGTTTAGFAQLNNVSVGAMPLVSPSSASGQNPYLLSVGSMCAAAQGMNGSMLLVDRLAETGLLSGASGNTCTLNNPVVSAWNRYSNGVGVMAFVESAFGAPATTASLQLTYTSPNNGSGRVTPAVAATAAVQHRIFGTSGPFFGLQGNDNGILSVESIALTVAAASNIALVICKPLLIIPCTAAYYYTERDTVIQTPKLPKLPVNADSSSCLQWIFLPGAATSSGAILSGQLSLVTG